LWTGKEKCQAIGRESKTGLRKAEEFGEGTGYFQRFISNRKRGEKSFLDF